MATVRQIEANRLNSLHSTGPRTEAGRARSRENALKHGLAGAGVVLPDEEADAVKDRLADWAPSLGASGPFEDWLCEVVAIESVRIDRCRHIESAHRERQARRALSCWDEDRRLAAEVVALGLSKRPALVVRQLRQTSQGCDWLLERWGYLAAILASGVRWDDAKRSLALDLLGVPTELRDGPTPLDPGPGESAAEVETEIVMHEVETLERLKADALDELDRHEQDAAELGLGSEVDVALGRLRRYEAASIRRLEWAMKRLRAGDRGVAVSEVAQAEAEVTADPIPVPISLSDPTPPVEPTRTASPPAPARPAVVPADVTPGPTRMPVPVRPFVALNGAIPGRPTMGNRRKHRARRNQAAHS